MKSVHLYSLYKYFVNEKIKNGEFDFITKSEVAMRGTEKEPRYFYCLDVTYIYRGEEKTVKLGGDWIIGWNDVLKYSEEAEEIDKEKQFKVIKAFQTMRWHVMWPCKTNGARLQTINMARKVSIVDALLILKELYNKYFEQEDIKEKKLKDDYPQLQGHKIGALIEAFCANKDYFLAFGNYENYKNFWNLGDFESEESLNNKIYEVIHECEKGAKK